MTTELGVGVIGIGMGASIAMINEIDDSALRVVGFCAPRQDKLDSVAAQTGVEFTTTDHRELIAQPDVDVVAVFSPDHLHFEHCAAALEAGKHVLCTKPLVTGYEDAQALVDLVRSSGKQLVVGQTMRFDPPFATARRLFDDGDLGEISVAEAHYVHDMRTVFPLTPWRLTVPQDFVYGGLCHPIDALRWFMGDVARVQVFGNKGTVSDYPLPDNFVVNLEFESGAIGRVLGTYGVVHQPMSMYGLGLYGNKGSLVARFADFLGGEIEYVLDRLPGERTSRIEFAPEVAGAYGHGETLIRMLRHLEACINGDEEPFPNVVEGAKTIAVGSAIWESLNTNGAVVNVKEIR